MKNLVLGTRVKLTIPIFSGSYKKAKFEREVEVIAKVVRDVYGKEGKHWFTFEILESADADFPVGKKKRMQGKNAYFNSIILEQPKDVEELTELKKMRKLTEAYY